MFKLTSLNLNGIRSAARKGVEAWIEKSSPDCICVQEIKAQAADGHWDTPAGSSEQAHGTVYSTTLCCLMLEVYYRYLPTGK